MLSVVRSVAWGFLLSSAFVSAQDTNKIIDFNRHGWYSYSGEHAIRGRWGVHFDGQWRRSDIVTNWQQYQLRPGLNFAAAPNVLLTLGYVYTRTYPYGDFPVSAAFPEHRSYQQALVRHPKKHVTLQQRFRLEQRFVRYPNSQDRSWTYQNRFRYLLKADFPLTRRADEKMEWYVPVYNEIVIGLPPNYGARPFDQNRIFAGIGYSLGAPGNIEVGYMKQFLGQRNGRIFEFNNTLFVTFTSNYSFSGVR